MGIAEPEGRAQTDLRQQLQNPLLHPVEPVDQQRFLQDIVHRVARMQGAIGVLKHHLKFAVEGFIPLLRQILAVDGHSPGPGSGQSGDRAQHRRFAGTRFAHEAEAFAFADMKADAADRMHGLLAVTEDDIEVFDLDHDTGSSQAGIALQHLQIVMAAVQLR